MGLRYCIQDCTKISSGNVSVKTRSDNIADSGTSGDGSGKGADTGEGAEVVAHICIVPDPDFISFFLRSFVTRLSGGRACAASAWPWRSSPRSAQPS